MSGSLHAYPHAHSSLLQVSIEALCLSITVVQFLFTTLTGLFHKKCNRLKARVVIYAYQHHVRLLSPEPMVVMQPQSTRVEGADIVMQSLAGQDSTLPVALALIRHVAHVIRGLNPLTRSDLFYEKSTYGTRTSWRQ